MQIRPLGMDQQSSLKGNVINVENDLDVCAQVLPRSFDDSSTVHVQLMRRLNYRTPYMYEVIRPAKVFKAAMYLKRSDLYQDVIFSDDWEGYRDGMWELSISF